MKRTRGLRILHLGPDSQFVQFAAEVFEEVAPGANEYLIFGPGPDGSLQNPIPSGRVRTATRDRATIFRLLARRWDYDLIIAHYMTPHAGAVFTRATRRAVTLWSGWGGDYYDRWEQFGPLTRDFLAGLGKVQSQVHRSLWERATGLGMNKLSKYLVEGAAKRADLFSAPIPTDERVFRSRYPAYRGEYAQINYASVDASFSAPQQPTRKRLGVLIGNSAAPSNNHFEALEMLASKDLSGGRVVVPLTYGPVAYRDAVIARGHQLFGDAFFPLVERMPLDEYNGIIAQCGIVIMNQRRQQALGNIGTALNAGATVFLDEVNPVYTFLRESGAVVRSTRELERAPGLPTPLSADDVATNRAFLESFWGAQRVRDNVAKLVERVRGSRAEN